MAETHEGGPSPLPCPRSQLHTVLDTCLVTAFAVEADKPDICFPAITLLGIYPKDTKIVIWRGTCTPMFIAVLSTIAKTWKKPGCPSTDKWIKMFVCVCKHMCVCIFYLIYPLICWWIFGFFPYLGYCGHCCSKHWGAWAASNHYFCILWINI